MSEIKFKIDGKEITASAGQTIIDAAAENGIYIPNLCHIKGEHPAGSCRICTVKVNGRNMASCTTPVTRGMEVENNTPELKDLRLALIELLFVEGNHFCPSCEKGGDCELQALGYKYHMMVPRFPYAFPPKQIDATSPKLFLERNRCIMCKRCIRTIKVEGKNVFAFRKRGAALEINIDHDLSAKMNDAEAKAAMDVCPVGAILKKEIGFERAIGTRKYDKEAIGSDIEK